MENSEEIRILLTQTITNFGVMKWDKLMEVLGEMCDKYDLPPPTKESTIELVGKINKYLNAIKAELVIFQHPIEETEYLVFSMPTDVKTTVLNAAEFAFFSKLLGEVVCAPEYYIPYLNAYNVMPSNSNVKLTKMRMQDLVKEWVDSGYFLAQGDNLHLGPRAMVEYEKQLEELNKDNIFKCPLCQKITFWKVSCQNCSTRYHDACIRKWLVKNSRCFSCKKNWNDSSQ